MWNFNVWALNSNVTQLQKSSSCSNFFSFSCAQTPSIYGDGKHITTRVRHSGGALTLNNNNIIAVLFYNSGKNWVVLLMLTANENNIYVILRWDSSY